jgi:hypothetical protein
VGTCVSLTNKLSTMVYHCGPDGYCIEAVRFANA